MIDLQKKCYEAWRLPTKSRKLLPNPLHDRNPNHVSRVEENEYSDESLDAEMAAWNQASDYDFRNFA